MQLSKLAQRIVLELHRLEVSDLLGNFEFWKRRFQKMNSSKRREFMDALEELEAEGYIVLSLVESENGYLFPKRILIREEQRIRTKKFEAFSDDEYEQIRDGGHAFEN